MAGYFKRIPVGPLLRFLMPFFLLAVATQLGDGQWVTPRVRTVFACVMLAAALDFFAERAADGGGGLRLLSIGLSAASWFLLLQRIVGYTTAVYSYSLGIELAVPLVAAGVAAVAIIVVVHVLLAAEALNGG